MVSLMSLWLPILLSAVLVFLASFLFHAVLTYHQSDVLKVPNEDQVAAALRGANIPPGDYMIPRGEGGAKAMRDPAFVEKMTRGPVLFMTVIPNGPPSMGKPLALWFVYCLVVSLFAGYIAGRALSPGVEYLEVFRFAGTTAFAGYVLALWQQSIWWHRNWISTLKSSVDGLIYALLTAGVFGWLWPQA